MEEIARAKTTGLLQTRELTPEQKANTELNKREMRLGATVLKSKPQRLVLELTNACNLKCIMCGRDEAEFSLTVFDFEHLKALEPLLNTVEEVTLFGWGEPTLHPQFENILKYLDGFAVKKYFVTNGMRLDKIKQAIFDHKVDIMAISVDGARSETNDKIRVNSSLDFIVKELKDIVRLKREKGVNYPYMNFVMTLFDSNLEELPALVELAADIGLEEVKGVYLTVFSEGLLPESLYNKKEKVEEVFKKAYETAQKHNIKLKLPHLQGEDPSEESAHKDCFVAYRDFFIGSDGFVRPCQSNPLKFFKYDPEEDFEKMWNALEFQEFRKNVNVQHMNEECKRCYQSSHANWNNEVAFIQTGQNFAPKWSRR
ncbi:radical SAM domain protein [Candidatus Gastranaerophilus sp. (ex Termes propinquus)]|nr:radical SAM domain protein [Candidatus Gastranaerophilus sp. (ex Termes propinquus)]